MGTTNTPDLGSVVSHLARPVYRYHQYQGLTNDCGPTSLAIAANTLLQKEQFAGPDLAEQMSRLAFEWRPFPHPVVSRIPGWATFPWGIVYTLRKHGFRARWRPLGSLEKLRQNLLANLITIVVIGEPLRWRKWRYAGWGHVKVIFGHTPGRGFLFVDPGYPRRPDDPWAAHGLFWQDEEEFWRQWRNLFRIYIEVE